MLFDVLGVSYFLFQCLIVNEGIEHSCFYMLVFYRVKLFVFLFSAYHFLIIGIFCANYHITSKRVRSLPFSPLLFPFSFSSTRTFRILWHSNHKASSAHCIPNLKRNDSQAKCFPRQVLYVTFAKIESLSIYSSLENNFFKLKISIEL